MAIATFTVADRPTTSVRSPFLAALKETLQTDKAVAVPINGETYAVTRNRVAANGSGLARRLKARLRTARGADGLSVLLWLEPKSDVNPQK